MVTDKLTIPLLLLFAFLLAACSQTAEGDRVVTPASVSAVDPTNTPLPSPVPTDTPAPTDTPPPTAVPTDTPIPSPTPDVTAVPTAEPDESASAEGEGIDETVIRIAVASANLRAGPGLGFETIGVVLFNDAFVVTDQDELGLWYAIELDNGDTGWVAASVTEEVSADVYFALIDTPDAIEPTPEPEPFSIQIREPSVTVRSGPGVEYDILTFAYEDEIFDVDETSPQGYWVRVTLEDGQTGWVATNTTEPLDQEAVAAIEAEEGDETAVEGEVEGEVADASADATDTNSDATAVTNDTAADSDDTAASPSSRPVSSVATSNNTSDGGGGTASNNTSTAATSNGGGSGGGGATTSGAAVSTASGRQAIYPGSSLYYDTDGSGYGAGIAVAPSGPDPRVIEEISGNNKPEIADGHQESADFMPGEPRIMLLGDGITSGTRPIANGYRRHLYRMLSDGGHFFDFVGTMNTHTSPVDFDSDHEGHVNYRADQVLAGVSQWAGFYPPDVAIVHVGTNDLLQGQSVASTSQDIELIVASLRYFNPNVKILLAQIIPTADGQINAQIEALNLEINRISWTHNTGNSPIYVVNQYFGFDPATDTYDGIHPNTTGAEKIARNFYQKLFKLYLIGK